MHADTYVHTYKHTHIHTYIVTTDRPPATNAITDTTPFRRCAATGDRHTRHKSTHNTHRFADALRQGIVTHEHAQVRGFEGEASLPVACCCVRPSSQQLLQRPVARLCACMSCRRVCVCVLYIHTYIYIYIYTYIHTNHTVVSAPRPCSSFSALLLACAKSGSLSLCVASHA